MQNLGIPGTPVNYDDLDQTCKLFYYTDPGNKQAHDALLAFEKREDAWTHIDKIIDSDQRSRFAKFLALQILTELIKSKWAILPHEQREAIKDFLGQRVISWSCDLSFDQVILEKLDGALVMIILREWPQQWPTIVKYLIESATEQPGTCKNNLKVISLLSQEIIEFGESQLTTTRCSQVCAALNDVSPDLFNLIEQVLSGTQDILIIKSALSTLKNIVKWLDPNYIFNTPLLNALCSTFLPNPVYQIETLAIFGEIASLKKLPDQYCQVFPQIFDLVVSALQQTLEPNQNFIELAENYPEVIRSLIFMFSSFITNYGQAIEAGKHFQSLGIALQWITEIMKITDFDNFKTCCEIWSNISRRFYLANNAAMYEFYNVFFPMVRRIMVTRMERPLDIIIVENENGTVTKEETRNTAQIELYNTMREALVLLANIDSTDTINAIREKIELLHTQRTFATLNSMCWSAGAISGSLSMNEEKSFVIMILKELLEMSSKASTIEEKAMISTGIMFVCSQYPRFLIEHYQFLKTIVLKLFEFMQNDFPGVKEMAVDSFKKIAEKCRRKFLMPEKNEPPLVESFILRIEGITSELSNELRAEMFNAISMIIAGCNDEGLKAKLTHDLMQQINDRWAYQLSVLNPNDFQGLVNVLFILRCNTYVADNVGSAFHVQLQAIFDQIITIYGGCCSFCTEMIQASNEMMSASDMFRLNSQIKSSVLQVLIKFVSKTANNAMINKILPPIMMQVLDEYSRCPAVCRVPELLVLMDEVIKKVTEEPMRPYIAQLFAQLFKPSVDLICADFDAFMSFRIPLTNFMATATKICFSSLTTLPAEAITMLEGTIEWGCKHPSYDICKPSFELLLNLYSQVETKASQQFKNQFYTSFFISSLSMVFEVMTDTVHKFAFIEQTKVIRKLLLLQIELNNLETIAQLLYEKFKNRELHFFVLVIQTLYNRIHSYPDFKGTLRDFLIEVRQYSKEDPDLFVEEKKIELMQSEEMLRQVPGIAGPASTEEAQQMYMANYPF